MTEGEITGAMARLHVSRAEAETHEYLGDGLYATFAHETVWLRTLSGMSVALDPVVLRNLDSYRESMKAVAP